MGVKVEVNGTGIKVDGLKGVVRALQRAQRKRGKPRSAAVVGYTQAYAIWVHEDREAHHDVGRAGYLLDVARENHQRLGKSIEADLKRGLTLEEALLRAGLLLQRESQKAVPVDTGALKGSAFTRMEGSGGADADAQPG